MIKKISLWLLIGGAFYICLVVLFLRQYEILTVHAEEIVNEIDGYIPLNDEDQEDIDPILRDSIKPIQEIEYEAADNNIYTEGDSDLENDSEVVEDSQVMEDDITENQKFQLMIIFCFGLVTGVIVGHFLTGFIK